MKQGRNAKAVMRPRKEDRQVEPNHSQARRWHRPNIVLVLADDLGYGDVGCYNSDSRIPAPHLDRLAAGGLRFTDAHSAAAVCTPSRYGLLTGRYCWRSPLKRSVLYSYEPPLIEPNRCTLASILRQEGYRTACIGKWHLGLGFTAKRGESIDFNRPLPWGDADRALEEKIDYSQPLWGGPIELGFDTFFGTSGCSTCQPPFAFIEDERFVEAPSFYNERFPYTGRPGMTAPGWKHSEADPTFIQKAVEFIESCSSSGRPFFLYLAASAPHEPCVESVVPEFARGRSEAGPRGDLVWLFDWMVGQVVQVLERCGQLESTLVFVTSDNGALPGDRVQGPDGRDEYRIHGHRSCGELRGYKAHIWEGGHREPLIVSWPGIVPAGTVCNNLVCLNDLPATVADLLEIELPDHSAEDSISFLPLLLAANGMLPGTAVRQDLVHHSGAGVFSIRRGSWKLIHETRGSGGWPPPTGGGPERGSKGQLYDLKEDPGEEHDLFDREPDLVRYLIAQLEQVQKSQ